MLLKSPDTCMLDWKIKNTKHHLEKLKRVLPWTPFKNTKRLTCSLGISYSYSGQTVFAHPFSIYPSIERLMETINERLGTNLNSVLINYYPKGEYVGIGLHKDDEKDLVPNTPVVSISLGESCDFILQDTYKGIPTERIVVPLHNSDVFVMGANCQKHYYHGIDYTFMEEDRFSLTFRQFK